MTKYYDNTVRWRERVTNIIYEIMGEQCAVCGYNKSRWSLHFHHLDPSKKTFNLSLFRTHTISWEKLESELRNCVLLCANCHGELHAGLIPSPEKSSFQEDKLEELFNKCKNCGKIVHHRLHEFCNKSCSAKYNHKMRDIRIDMRFAKTVWSTIDVIELLKRNDGNMWKSGKEIGLTDNAVKKRFQKVTGFKNWKEYQQHESNSV